MQAHHPSLFGGRRERRNPSRAGRDLSPRARSRPGWLCIVTSKTGEATSYRGRADVGRRQQAEKDVGRNSQDALVLQYVYRLLTEVRPQTRDRLKREISSFWAHESLSLTGETKPTGYLPIGRYWEVGCPLFHQLHRQPDHPLHWSSPPVY